MKKWRSKCNRLYFNEHIELPAKLLNYSWRLQWAHRASSKATKLFLTKLLNYSSRLWCQSFKELWCQSFKAVLYPLYFQKQLPCPVNQTKQLPCPKMIITQFKQRNSYWTRFMKIQLLWKYNFCPCIHLRGKGARRRVFLVLVGLCGARWHEGLVSYIWLAQMMSGSALPKHQVGLCVKYDIFLAVRCCHRSVLDQYRSTLLCGRLRTYTW